MCRIVICWRSISLPSGQYKAIFTSHVASKRIPRAQVHNQQHSVLLLTTHVAFKHIPNSTDSITLSSRFHKDKGKLGEYLQLLQCLLIAPHPHPQVLNCRRPSLPLQLPPLPLPPIVSQSQLRSSPSKQELGHNHMWAQGRQEEDNTSLRWKARQLKESLSAKFSVRLLQIRN